MKSTPQQYADAIVKEIYKVDNLYNLAPALAYVSTKLGIWAMKKAEIATWATDGTKEHEAENLAEWEIADKKFKAYLIAFNTLQAKLQEFVMEVEL